MKQILPKSKDCFFCGTDNPIGLHLDYYFEDNKVYSNFTADKLYRFSEHFLHLGIVQSLLFEGMVWLPTYILQQHLILVDLNIKVLMPIPHMGKMLNAVSEVLSLNKWLSEIESVLSDDRDNIYVKAVGKFMIGNSSSAYLSDHFIL